MTAAADRPEAPPSSPRVSLLCAAATTPPARQMSRLRSAIMPARRLELTPKHATQRIANVGVSHTTWASGKRGSHIGVGWTGLSARRDEYISAGVFVIAAIGARVHFVVVLRCSRRRGVITWLLSHFQKGKRRTRPGCADLACIAVRGSRIAKGEHLGVHAQSTTRGLVRQDCAKLVHVFPTTHAVAVAKHVKARGPGASHSPKNNPLGLAGINQDGVLAAKKT